MRLFGWLKGAPQEDPRLKAWRQRWNAVAENGSGAAVQELTRELDALALPDEEIEVEREMLDGLAEVAALVSQVHERGLPAIETGHRVVGADACHFVATASMPDEPGQPAGRLFLTGARTIFAGGGSSTAVPWHTVADVARHDRDLVLVRVDRQHAYRFRCNAYGEALCAAFLARRLAGGRQRQPPGL